MSRQVFVSDTHFGHAGILSPRMQNPRPFASIEAHDETLIANWNSVVRPDDTVWHLGDFCCRCSEDYARSVFSRLRGRYRFLVRGNHDRIGARLPWDGTFDVAQVVVQNSDSSTTGVWCSHYAHRVWPRMHRGDLHIYGHSHGGIPAARTSLHVGVNCWDWAPVTLSRILARMAASPAIAP